jgi:DnaJ-domain-containing protein 1
VQLNDELDELQSYRAELDRREYTIHKRSGTTFNRWARVSSFQFALRWTTATYLIIAAILYVSNPGFIESISDFVGKHILVRISGVHDALYGSVLVSTVLSAVLLWALYRMRRDALDTEAQEMGVCMGYFADDGESEIESADSDRLATNLWNYRFEHNAQAARRYESGSYYEEADEDAECEGEAEDEKLDGEKEWYETLEVPETASASEINNAWRLKMTRNHPDRVAQLDPEFRALAEERTKRLNAAREEGLVRCKRTG